MTADDLLRCVVESEWLKVTAMPVQTKRTVLLDIVFFTADEKVAITGKAHELKDGTEAFSLDIYRHNPEEWWIPQGRNTEPWVPRDIGQELRASRTYEILTPPRGVRYFTAESFKDRAHLATALLDNCAAIELFKYNDPIHNRLVIRASNDCPFTLDFAITPSRCEHLLSSLIEIELDR